MYRLFLDDERHPFQVTWVDMPPGPWIVVRSYNAFVAQITSDGLPSFISFDHDLGIEAYIHATGTPKEQYAAYYADPNRREMTGYDCARWLIGYCHERALPIPSYQIHSMNPIGRDNIRSVLDAARERGPRTERLT